MRATTHGRDGNWPGHYVVLTAVNGRFLRMFDLWSRYYRATGVGWPVHVAAFGADACAAMQARASCGDSLVVHPLAAGDGPLVVRRFHVLRALLDRDLDVVLTDLDAFWLSESAGELPDRRYDVQASIAGYGWPPAAAAAWGFSLCCGFMVVHSTAATRRLVDRWLPAARRTDDQHAFNSILLDCGMSWKHPGRVEGNRGACPALGLTVGAIDYRRVTRIQDIRRIDRRRLAVFHPRLTARNEEMKVLQSTARLSLLRPRSFLWGAAAGAALAGARRRIRGRAPNGHRAAVPSAEQCTQRGEPVKKSVTSSVRSVEARDYLAYGLRFRSAIALPFVPVAGNGEPNVVVRLGAVPEAAGLDSRRGLWRSAAGLFTLAVDGVARYAAKEGREIVVETAGGSEAAVLAFLKSSVLAACLQQRGILPLHASAVATASGAVLFAGRSGSGKSTLAAALIERGYDLLADDVTGVELAGDGRPRVLPAFPCVQLWPDAVEQLAWQGRTARKLREELDKHVVPVGRFHAAPLAVRAVFALDSHNRSGFEMKLTAAAAAFETLVGLVYRERFVRGSEPRRTHFRAAAALARRAPVVRVKRPANLFLLDALADEIERYLQVDRQH